MTFYLCPKGFKMFQEVVKPSRATEASLRLSSQSAWTMSTCRGAETRRRRADKGHTSELDRLPQGRLTSFCPLLWSPAPRLNEMLWFHSMEKLLEVYSLRCMCVCVCDWSGGALSTPSRPPFACHRWLFHLNYKYGSLHQVLALNVQNGKCQLDLNVWGAENMKTNVI